MTKLPQFSQIKTDEIKSNIEQAIAHCKKTIDNVLCDPAPISWQNKIVPMDEADDAFSRLWSPVSHMNSVVNSPELRNAYESCLPLLSEYSTFIGQHKGLYDIYQSLSEQDDFKSLSKEQQKTITDQLRDFQLSGIALPETQQKRYGEIVARLSELSSKFSNNVLDATLAWHKHIQDESQLSGLPESAIAAAKHTAEQKSLDGWVFTLEFPSYLPVMTYADNRELRKEMYEAFTTKASDQGPNAGEFDNSNYMEEILALRHELAQLLGFSSYADKSLATKMAESPKQVLEFLENLAKRSKKQAEKELAELQQFTTDNYQMTDLQAWDIAYYSEKLKQEKYAISDEELRPYFPERRVVSGLFEVMNRLFGLKISEQTGVDTWHPDVRYFNITDAQGNHRGSFYLDLFAREHKRGGAWMDECHVRRINQEGDLQHPVAYLTCNFNKPIGDKPALFTHDEVVTLFHEFGHGIHHMLTQMTVPSVSGINGVAWDAVELPSQFLENWCWEEEALAFISGHYESGDPLPKDMLDKLLAAKNFQSAMFMVRQLEFALFDFRMHHEYDPASGGRIQHILDQVRESVSVIIPPAFNRFQHGFSHIFAGGYAAGYYSYKWAEVLSSDAYARFEDEGIFNQETGRSFLQNILEKGGSQEPMDLFKAFRGREPEIDALLRHSGIA
ncbi:oligopeptidase A [Algicola sagamiensis]|uniref:oligopeptidase A n=1 Tax=Algicola sagamiensis TaxID=163869 RepID=UPI000360B0AE|nr:oligopeptidase A [Algicola sagamiensis]